MTPTAHRSPWWSFLLGIHPGHGSLSFGWAHPLAGWAWAVVVLAAAGFAAWSYHHLVGRRGGRITLAVARTLLIFTVAVLLAGPMLVELTQHTQPDTLLVLVDRSASMQVKDTLDRAGQPVSRSRALDQMLMQQKTVFGTADKQLGHQRKILWLGFGKNAFAIDPPWATRGLGPADRDDTRIRSAIDQALNRAGAAPIAGIVLLTDGQTSQSTGPALVHRLARDGVSVFPVCVGAKQLPIDLAVTAVDAPPKSFKGDLVPVSATIERLGGGSLKDIDQAQVQLVSATGKILDHAPLTSLSQPIHLSAPADHVGKTDWQVRVVFKPSSHIHELNTDNNSQPVHVDIIDRPIRVLYVDGYPRWQYRYLKNMLIREKSIAASILLLSSNTDYAQQGDIPIRRFPETAKELRPYDVIILGDIAADALSDKQLSLIRDHVAQDGAGLLLIGGDRYMPDDWAGNTLADLLPMQDPGSVSPLPAAGGIRLLPTSQARRLNLFNLRGPGIRPGHSWPANLRPLQWAQNLGSIKPAAEILARSEKPHSSSPGGNPLVVRMRYGAGQSVYVATDETWRWRYARGDIFFQQFWIQLTRMLARSRLALGSGRAQLTVSHNLITRGDTVLVKLTTDDPSIMSRQMSQVHIAVKPADQPNAGNVDSLTLRRASAASDGRQVFEAPWQPSTLGKLSLTVDQPGLADLDIHHPVTVISPTDERRHPQTDFPRLVQLAKDTGGAVVPLNDLKKLTTLVPDRARINEQSSDHPIWNSPLALILLLILLTAEWIGRKAIRLV